MSNVLWSPIITLRGWPIIVTLHFGDCPGVPTTKNTSWDKWLDILHLNMGCLEACKHKPFSFQQFLTFHLLTPRHLPSGSCDELLFSGLWRTGRSWVAAKIRWTLAQCRHPGLNPVLTTSTPFAVYYQKIRNHLRETASNSAKIHSSARKYEHFRMNQIRLFTVPYFSVRLSRSKTLRYRRPS